MQRGHGNDAGSALQWMLNDPMYDATHNRIVEFKEEGHP
jgi:hypothetical protein